MYVLRAGRTIEVWTPAKLNLFLEILARRQDGYHELETLMCPIALYDTLYFRDEARGQISFTSEIAAGPRDATTRGGGVEELPEGPDNSAVKAVQRLRARTGYAGGARLHLVKRIPLAAGLAGGSSDAAAALVAANESWRLGLSRDALAEVAAEVGSDVPFFLSGGPAVCRGRGERVEPIPPLGALHFVVVRPPAGLSTADVYRACRVANRPRPLGPLLDALQQGNLGQAGRLLHNGLQGAAESLSPWIRRLNREFARHDLCGHQMSGSGTSYFGVARHARHARRVAAALQNRGVGRVYAVRASR